MVRHLSLIPLLKFLSLTAALLLLAGCREPDPHIMVTDVTQAERLSIGKIAGTGTVKQLRLHIEGQLNGSAQLTVLMEGQPYHVFNLSDAVDLTWSDKWPHDRARLAYTPGMVTSGSLRIKYRFVD
ncbi:hypothetical protein MASR2M8_06110 [Opitutaceae bacterium]